MLNLAVTGACGKMGKRIVTLAHQADDLRIVAAMEHHQHPDLNRDIGILAGLGEIDVKLTPTLPLTPDVLIDFSIPESTLKWLQHCQTHKIPMVIGTTGLADEQTQAVHEAAADIPILLASNMSLGVNLLFQLVAQVAQSLDDNYDIEIVETHHRFKRDAPSGTALELARRITAVKQWPFPDSLTQGRHGKDTLRQPHTIGMHSLRAGDTVGIHQVLFSCLGESIELKHTAHSRDTFVRGALQGARFLAIQSPGLYNMLDVLGLK